MPIKLLALDKLKQTNLKYTIFYIRFLLDYHTGPSIKSYISPLVIIINMEYSIAVISGSGNILVVFTHSLNIRKYVNTAVGHFRGSLASVGRVEFLEQPISGTVTGLGVILCVLRISKIGACFRSSHVWNSDALEC